MNRKHYESPFSRDELPSWRCPSCGKGALALDASSLITEEKTDSKNARKNPDWEPDWIEQQFSSLLKCVKCSEPVFMVGKTGMMESFEEEHGWGLEEGLVPRFFQPALYIIEVPKKTPDSIRSEIYQASSLYWSSPSSSSNRLRVAVERLMDYCKIPRKGKTKKGKFNNLSLHARLERYQKKNEDVAELLLAVKWLGNTGSHENELTRSDTLDGFELISHALDEIFEKKSERLKRKATDINQNKGPADAKSRKHTLRVRPA